MKRIKSETLAVLVFFVSATTATATPIFEETFDNGDYTGWTVTTIGYGEIRNMATHEDDGLRPVVTYIPDMVDENGHHKPWTGFTKPLVGLADVNEDGVKSPSLMLRVGADRYDGANGGNNHHGALVSRDFSVPEAGRYTIRADAMALPYVPYWQYVSGGRFGLIVNDMERSVFDAGWIGLSVATYQANRHLSGALFETMEVDVDLDAGLNTLAFSITRSGAIVNNTAPAQLLDDISITPWSAPATVTPLASTPLPPAVALLGAGALLLGAIARRR